MAQTQITKARLINWGIPVVSHEREQTAVWQGDDITILRRSGSHYFCLIEYGYEGYEKFFLTWIHKRALRRKDRPHLTQ